MIKINSQASRISCDRAAVLAGSHAGLTPLITVTADASCMSSDPSRRRVLHALGVGGVFALGANDGSKAHTLSGPDSRSHASATWCTPTTTLRAYDAGGEALWSYRTPEIQISDTVGHTIHGRHAVDGAVYVSARDALHGLGPAE